MPKNKNFLTYLISGLIIVWWGRGHQTGLEVVVHTRQLYLLYVRLCVCVCDGCVVKAMMVQQLGRHHHLIESVRWRQFSLIRCLNLRRWFAGLKETCLHPSKSRRQSLPSQ